MASPSGAPAVREGYQFRIAGRLYDLASRTHIMGILNVTPDSFSDGGRFMSVASAVDRALAMAEEGADFIDIGGESTRPKGSAYGEGAEPVSLQEELDRVIPVVEALTEKLIVPLSVDTYKAPVAARALAAGAAMVNDISGLRFDPAMASTVAEAGATAVVMHIRGTPKTMQSNPVYGDLFGEIISSLRDSVRAAREAGIRQVFVDPGIGFGKTADDNYRLIAGLSRFDVLGCPVLIGPSRKSFLAAASGLGVQSRLEGSIAAATASALNGAHVVRVHDVRETRRALQVADMIRRAET